jgi:hypothetical protein
MLSTLVSLLMLFMPLAQQQSAQLLYEIRASPTLIMGKGLTSGLTYYDVVITRQPNSGVLVKLDYSRRSTAFSFDLHHRLALTPDFPYPAEIITNIEVLSGGTTSIGTFTIIDTIKSGDAFEEMIDKVSKAEVDRSVTPIGKKTVTLKLASGSQSLSIVGQAVTLKHGTTTTRIDTPGQRIAVISNFRYQEDQAGTILNVD